jgi:hypothetical protein
MKSGVILQQGAGDLTERTRALAQQYWEEEGRPEGRAEEHWIRAEQVVLGQVATATGEGEFLSSVPGVKGPSLDQMVETVKTSKPRRKESAAGLAGGAKSSPKGKAPSARGGKNSQ